MISGLFKNVTYKLFPWWGKKKDIYYLSLNTPQGLIYYKGRYGY